MLPESAMSGLFLSSLAQDFIEGDGSGRVDTDDIEIPELSSSGLH